MLKSEINSMRKIIAVANQKGGVGKTTTSVNVSAALAISHKSVLLVDLDPQANATSGLGIEAPNVVIYDCLIKKTPAREAIVETQVEGLHLLPSGSDLAGAEVELAEVPNREHVLSKVVDEIKDHYDYIFFDCPPALGLLTVNALAAAHSVLIPVQCEYYAMEGLGRLITNIDRVRDSFNSRLELEGILLTMWDSRLSLSKQVSDEVRKFFGQRVYHAMIPRNISLAEAPSYGRPGLLYNAASSGSKAYTDVAKELLENGEKGLR